MPNQTQNNNSDQEIDQILSNHFFINKNDINIIIPVKTHKSVDFIQEELLQYVCKQHNQKDLLIAKEMCLYFLSFLRTPESKKTEIEFEKSGYKNLNSNILNNLFRPLNKEKISYYDGTNLYKKFILNCLFDGTQKKGCFVECDNSFCHGEQSKSLGYRLSSVYRNKGYRQYKIQSKYVMDLIYRNMYEMVETCSKNTIVKNCFKFYKIENIKFPTSQELLIKGKQLVKEKFITKSGKLLTMRNKHEDSYWKESVAERSFVEDNILDYEFLTQPVFYIPTESGSNNGKRIIDSITLMPSWIRDQITVDGENLVELDFKCLHPNVASTIYGGPKNITHDVVANYLGITKQQVKTQHLAYFNDEPKKMVNYKVHEFYKQYPDFIDNIIADKKTSELGYKITSKECLSLEVKLMTKIIEKLNNMGIYVGYVYDALLCKKSDAVVVQQIMNQTAMEMNINTTTGTLCSQQAEKHPATALEQPSKEEQSKHLDEHSKAVYCHLKGLETFTNYIGNTHSKAVSKNIKTVLEKCEKESLSYIKFLKLIQKASNKNKIIKDLKIYDFLQVQIYNIISPKKTKWNYDTMSVLNEEKEIYSL